MIRRRCEKFSSGCRHWRTRGISLKRREIGRYRNFFTLDHYRIVVLRTDGNTPNAEASIKITVDGKAEHTVAEGDGPVAALDAALRRAIQSHYPAIADLHLTD